MTTQTGESLAQTNGFHLSRVQAEGWTAAHKFMNGGISCNGAKVSSLNPYKTEEERVRWFAGFNSALARL